MGVIFRFDLTLELPKKIDYFVQVVGNTTDGEHQKRRENMRTQVHLTLLPSTQSEVTPQKHEIAPE